MTNKKRVCFYSIATHLGGAEKSLLELLSEMSKHEERGYEPWVVVPKEDGPLIDRLKKRDIPVTVVKMPRAFLDVSRRRPLLSILSFTSSAFLLLSYYIRLLKTLKQNKPAIIHTTGLKCHLIGAMAGRQLRIPVLWHLRDIFSSGFSLRLFKFFFRCFKPRCVANSQATADSFSSVTRNCPVIYNGLDPLLYHMNHNRQFHGLFNVPNHTPIVGIVGVLARWKGQVEFIKMAKLLSDKKIEVRFVIIGAEIYDTHGEKGFTQTLKDQVEDCNLQHLVQFVGFQENIAQSINGLDVLVHASIEPEPFGRVIVEAFACGTPVVASNLGGVREMVVHEKTGLLFRAGDVEDMATQVSRLLNSPELSKRLCGNARSVFENKFTQKQHFDSVLKFYEENLR